MIFAGAMLRDLLAQTPQRGGLANQAIAIGGAKGRRCSSAERWGRDRLVAANQEDQLILQVQRVADLQASLAQKQAVDPQGAAPNIAHGQRRAFPAKLKLTA
jgi:hypothetical protein